MKKKFSTKWKSSKNPRKQRKYKVNAPLHIKSKFLNVHLSKELKKKYNKRNIRVRMEDKVKIVRGQFKKKSGKIVRVDVNKTRVYVEGIENIKKDGTKSLIPLNPSNLIIQEIILDDKIRKMKLERK